MPVDLPPSTSGAINRREQLNALQQLQMQQQQLQNEFDQVNRDRRRMGQPALTWDQFIDQYHPELRPPGNSKGFGSDPNAIPGTNKGPLTPDNSTKDDGTPPGAMGPLDG